MLLVHCCCVHCSAYTLRYWREQGFDVTSYWYNPNIHPTDEHQERLQALRRYLTDSGIELVVDGDYRPDEYDDALTEEKQKPARCSVCYSLRLQATAGFAASEKYDGFTTSLLISPQQYHKIVRDAGLTAADEYGVKFKYTDIRKRYSDSRKLTRPLGLYRQRYCGCRYSAEEASVR